MPVYEERQRFASWVYLLTLAVLAGTSLQLAWVVKATGGLDARILFATGIPLILVLVIFLVGNLLELRTQVRREEIYACLGTWIPLFWTRLPLADIQDLRCVTYRPIRDAGGWGMRFGRFEGRSCRFFNARGNQGVLVETSTRRYIIGSQEPERLYTAILEAQKTRTH